MALRHKDLTIPEGTPATQAFVQILDPATGTGTFLVEVIDLIHGTLIAKWRAAGKDEDQIETLWNEYVPEHLLPRIHGYELMMAPYAIAHLKVGLKLYETGYRFESDERARVFLTNSLEPARDFSEQLEFTIPAFAHEADAVRQVKRRMRFTVVIGNPPYSKLSSNLAPEHRQLVDAYRHVNGERVAERGALALEMNLQDDYVKFVRLAQMALDVAGTGVAGLITNHGYLSTPTLRGMRWSLLRSFKTLRVLDLHGHSGKGEVTPDGTKDENVFDIQQGVAVSLCTRPPDPRGDERVFHADLYGLRERKYEQLQNMSLTGTPWKRIAPSPPHYRFVPEDVAGMSEFGTWLRVSDLLVLSSDGIVTARDGLVVAFTEMELLDRISAFREAAGSGAEVCKRFGIAFESAGFRVEETLRALRRETDLAKHVIRIQYRPFDYRFLFYFRGLVQSMRWPVTSQLAVQGNVLLAATRQVNRPQYEHTLVSRYMFEKKAVSHDRNTQVFPVVVTSDDGGLDLDPQPRGNWGREFCEKWVGLTGRDPTSPEVAREVLTYVYAILHSPTYRVRYFSFLRSEFPRIPMPASRDLLDELFPLGRELVGLHLMETGLGDQGTVSYVGPEYPEVRRVGWSDGTVWLDGEKTRKREGRSTIVPGSIGFHGVPEAVWNFHVGGYQVCEKWLKDRKGRTLLRTTSPITRISSPLSRKRHESWARSTR